MKAQIRPNRLDISDRFPLASFTIRTDGQPRQAEIVVATSPELFTSREGRNRNTFYSTREQGVLSLPRADAVYTLPPEVLSRFTDADRLWFGLATAPAGSGDGEWSVDVSPTESSPYISLSGLTDGSLRRVRMFPRRTGSYGSNQGEARLTWAGDSAQGAQQAPQAPQPPAPGPNAGRPNGAAQPAADMPYDDGFGPLPGDGDAASPPAPEQNAPTPNNTERDETAPITAQGLAVYDPATGREVPAAALEVQAHLLQNADYEISDERRAIAAPETRELTMAERVLLEGLLLTAGPLVSVGRLAANQLGCSVAIGVGANIAGTVGASIGTGIIFAPGGEYGIYGLGQLDIGAIISGSATMQVTVLQGGVSAFDGISLLASVSGGEGIVGGISAIFSQSGRFMGVTFEAGLGFGSPISVYSGIQRSYSTSVGHSLGHVPVQAMDLDAIQLGSDGQSIAAPRTDTFTQVRSIAIQALLAMNPPFLAFVVGARAAAELGNVSVGIGNSISGGLMMGGGLGAGLIFAPGNVMGAYGGAEINAGWITGIGANFQLTVLKGGIESFQGISRAVAISGGEGVTAGAAAIFDADDNFLGVSLQVGVGLSLTPFEIYTSVQRQVATQLGMAMAFGSEQEALASGMGGGNEEIEIKYRMFIPSPILQGLPLMDDFGGDGRGYSYSSGTHRGQMSAVLEVNPAGEIVRVKNIRREWGETTSYDKDDTTDVAGKPWWWNQKKNSSVRPTNRATQRVADSNLKIYRGAPRGARRSYASANGYSAVTMYAAGKNPLVSLAPAIDADVTLFFRRNSDRQLEVKVKGDHDGFPGHELYVNGQHIHGYLPQDHGGTPNSLFPPSDRDVDTRWRTVRQRTSSGQSYDARAMGDDIPLDPGVGGMSIGMDALEPGDLIVSTTAQPESGVIRVVTGQPVSHVMMYVGQGGQVIEARRDGVRLKPIEEALEGATLAVAYRVPGLSDMKRLEIASKAAEYLDRDFDFVGIVNAAFFRIAVAACRRKGLSDNACRRLVAWSMDGAAHPTKFFCSALVLRAYQDAEARLTVTAQNWASPGDIPEYTLRDDSMEYVGHLVTPLAPYSSAHGETRAFSENQSRTINWDTVQQIAQPTGKSCWATSAAMVLGWRDDMSITPQFVGEVSRRSIKRGIAGEDFDDLAREIGLTYAPAQSLPPSEWFAMLEDYGPLFVAEIPGKSGHVVVVTGMYNEGDNWFVRITDPWDKVVDANGRPTGKTPSIHATGSRYILPFGEFVRAYEAAAPHAVVQVLHSNGTHGKTPNRGTSTPQGYAMSEAGTSAPAPAPTPTPAPAPSANGTAEEHGFGPGVSVTRQTLDNGQRRYELAQLKGFVQPQTGYQAAADAQRAAPIQLGDWPYIDGPNGRTQAGVAIDWSHQGGAVGNIGITPLDGTSPDGWNVQVIADVLPGEDSPGKAKVMVEVVTIFTKQGEEEQIAVSMVTLCGDGTNTVTHDAGNSRSASPGSGNAAGESAATPEPAPEPARA